MYTKLAIGLIFLTVIIKFPQVEKIKLLATPIFVLFTFIFLCIVSHDMYLIYTDYEGFKPKADCKFGDQTEREYFIWENLTVYVGIVMFGFELIASLFPIRNAMKDPKKITKVSISAYIFLLCLFLSMGILTYTVYGNDTKQTAFYCYTWEHNSFFYLLQCLFMLFLSPFIPFYIISIFEPLEYFDSYKRFLTNPDGTLSTDRKVLIRSIGTTCIVAVCFISDKVSDVTEFKGNF